MHSLSSALIEVNVTATDGADDGLIPSETLESLAAEFESEVARFERMSGKASVEGLASITARAVIALLEFIKKITHNLQYTLVGLFKDVRRSELQAFSQNNTLNLARLYRADYSRIYKAKVPYFPYNQPPLSISSYTNDTFKVLDMYPRFISVIEGYMQLAASIRSKDEDSTLSSIRRLNDLNEESFVRGIQTTLKSLVITRIPSKYGTFGQWFSSMSEAEPVVVSTLKSAHVFDDAVSVGKKLGKLYKSLDSVHDSIDYLINSSFNISKLKGITGTVRNTGHLIEIMGVLTKEQSHLEHWQVEAFASGIKNNK